EVVVREVSHNYFATLRARLIRGRYFTVSDNASKPPVVIIDQSMAKKYFPGEDPVGQTLLYSHIPETKPMEIVGVIADIKEGALDETTWPAIYVAIAQDPSHYFTMLVRTSHDEH